MTQVFIFFITLLTSTYSIADSKSICGDEDGRILSFEPKIGRLSTLEDNKGCTATLISDSCAITAGHCKDVLIRAEFNTPLSVNGIPQPSKIEDVYMIDSESIKLEDDGPGKDWAVFKFKANTITQKLPGEVQGYYNISYSKVRKKNQIRITGYGVDKKDKTGNFAQQTHTGTLKSVGNIFNRTQIKHDVDTMGGNSGSTIILEKTQEIIGIHSHGGCTDLGGTNAGTLISKHKRLIKAIKSCIESDI